MNQEGIQVQEYQFEPIGYKLSFYNIYTYSIEIYVYAINEKESERAIIEIEKDNPHLKYLSVGMKKIKCPTAKTILKHCGCLTLYRDKFYYVKQIETGEK